MWWGWGVLGMVHASKGRGKWGKVKPQDVVVVWVICNACVYICMVKMLAVSLFVGGRGCGLCYETAVLGRDL